jgi:hypothetical protein
VSLMLGIFVRFWGVIGALQILNLWLGLYNAAGEWPWTYFFLLVDQALWLYVMLSFGFVAFSRTDAAAARSGGQGRPLPIRDAVTHRSGTSHRLTTNTGIMLNLRPAAGNRQPPSGQTPARVESLAEARRVH